MGEKPPPKRPQKNGVGTKQDMGDKEHQEKRLTDEAMVDIACDEIVTDTTAVALRGEAPYPDTVTKLPYAGSQAVLRIQHI